MRIDKLTIEETDKIEIAIQKKLQIEKRLIGQHLSRVDGGKMFVYNCETKTLTEATYHQSVNYYIHKPNEKRIDITLNCVYIEAINLQNAHRKLLSGKFAFVS